eukprot:TRINITY_DN1041_c0_g3_i1.p1 TRINITY_DN1041_c0_g3~~TRINITY_DN1041_c0_g3_i1.p1  ORF type:complete len:258 (+),score=46.42 TRINITY_DN1041_c0_g3_i1:235-1008(+)
MSKVDLSNQEAPQSPPVPHLAAQALSPSLPLSVKDHVDVDDYQPPQPRSPFRLRKRIAVLGARAVGKSAVAIKCTSDRFEPEYMPTCEDSFLWTTVVDGSCYEVTIVDTDGQDEFPDFGQQYTIGTDGYILMFSVLSEHSFYIIKRVHEKLLDTLQVLNRKGTKELPRILVGNQVDDNHARCVSRKVAQDFADENAIPYYETSALTGENVTDVFNRLLRIIHANQFASPESTAVSSKSKSQRRHSQSQDNPNFCNVQ